VLTTLARVTGAALLFFLVSRPAHADVTLLLGAPYGKLGGFSPTGHAALYFDRVCADTPTSLRHCEPGESGAVISRYGGVGGLDWVAMPLFPFLYAVDSLADVPSYATRAQVVQLRDAYRRAHLRSIAADAPGGDVPKGNWFQLVGSVYDRHIVGFTVRTTKEQDARVVAVFQARENRERFNFFFRNCADFSRDVLNLYFPGALRDNFIADLGLTTPKQMAKSLVKYADRHPELELSSFVIPQIPGNRPEGHRAKGVAEALVKTPRYLVPLAIVQPWVPAGLGVAYLTRGRYDPESRVEDVLQPSDVDRRLRRSADDAPSR
jgi:hypothetical protein